MLWCGATLQKVSLLAKVQREEMDSVGNFVWKTDFLLEKYRSSEVVYTFLIGNSIFNRSLKLLTKFWKTSLIVA